LITKSTQCVIDMAIALRAKPGIVSVDDSGSELGSRLFIVTQPELGVSAHAP
jgi:hypothetical protein